ncbi:DUF305 domain-containing protein [Nocardioides solisilvae]|uniref:DUF305 domain-containing protein n=1 Tax=Nocardioides solisilvae TaxID=1542435 RepID=UPI000D74C8E1|nr:DUF305 domain-containing protein [Nocardioides solisilvae]
MPRPLAPRTSRARRRPLAALAAPLLVLLLALVAAGCSGDDDDVVAEPSEGASETDHNEADVAFAQEMIPHHAQALVMVDMAQGRTTDPEFEQLLEAIRAAQGPEIEEMADWLVEWGEEVPETMRDHARGGGHGGDDESMGERMEGLDHGMPGMMGPEELEELDASADDRFQDMWLTMMIDHHEGAIEMAQDLQQDGQYGPAIALAESIEESQTAEIAQMEEMLAS